MVVVQPLNRVEPLHVGAYPQDVRHGRAAELADRIRPDVAVRLASARLRRSRTRRKRAGREERRFDEVAPIHDCVFLKESKSRLSRAESAPAGTGFCAKWRKRRSFQNVNLAAN